MGGNNQATRGREGKNIKVEKVKELNEKKRKRQEESMSGGVALSDMSRSEKPGHVSRRGGGFSTDSRRTIYHIPQKLQPKYEIQSFWHAAKKCSPSLSLLFCLESFDLLRTCV